MIVTFVAQCEKKALDKTRMILDSYASRIGDRTWQTVITQEGLNAVRRLLRKSASKNTAVACHWIRSHRRTELIWIVGNRHKFNAEGHVPVHTTRAQVINTEWENNWQYMPVINALSALAALFHDWGKATLCFQKKLQASKPIADPLRHEWISCLLLNALVRQHDSQDALWLSQLVQTGVSQDLLNFDLKRIQKPLANLPSAASLIAWLVLSHHRLPLTNKDLRGHALGSFQEFFVLVAADYGYENRLEPREFEQRLPDCFVFPQGFLIESEAWNKQLKKWASRLLNCLPLLEKAIQDGTWRLILHYSRLSLMLADHHYSSQAADQNWVSSIRLFANTDRLTGTFKQKLDEHLVRVAENALKINHFLPAFETTLPLAQDIRPLKKKSQGIYIWQDKAVEAIKTWRRETLESSVSISQSAFFAVNMASTGLGKTMANAKIMRILSEDGDSLRYILALGLRTLTLQTGDEYRSRIGLDDTELAVLIGSSALQQLHSLDRQTSLKQDFSESGSESQEPLLEGEIYFSAPVLEERLNTVLRSERDRKFLYAPVLVCTLDHMMAATETIRGGRYILPSLRLMSSDLVIDEIDDFDGSDLIAIGRLIHLAGMSGRKVMISSATIPPDLAEGYLHAYRQGWLLYAKSRNLSQKINCAWVDEFKTEIKVLDATENAVEQYHGFHSDFIFKRVKKLSDPLKTPVRRKAKIILCDSLKTEESALSLTERYFELIRKSALEKHRQHHLVDPVSGKRISFGLIRVANILPCIELVKFLLQAPWEEGVDAKIMAYHSQQVLLLRSAQEKHLDQVLKRKDEDERSPAIFQHPVIRAHLENSEAEDMVFILVATPVEEIGRDHDFDWAVVEPSSFRSIIQLAGRVLRHRDKRVESENIALMQYNLKALQGKTLAYHRPGYERKAGEFNGKLHLSTHDLNILLQGSQIEEQITAIPRIQKPIELLPQERFADLEHETMAYLLSSYQALGCETLQGWLTQNWWLSALPQKENPFRKGQNTLSLTYIWEEGNLCFMEKHKQGDFHRVEQIYNIQNFILPAEFENRLWLKRDYLALLEEMATVLKESMTRVSQRFGEIQFSFYENQRGLIYSDQFGLFRSSD